MEQISSYNGLNAQSFGAMKKSQFKGLDLLCVNTFKAPIEKFNSNLDLQKWAGKQLEGDTFTSHLQARSSRATFERNSAFKSWMEYFNNTPNITKASALVAISSMFGGLKNKTDDVPPPLDTDVLEKTINNSENNQNINFKKDYINNLQNKLIGDKEALKHSWVSIPSKENAPEDFENNVAKLKLLSSGTWCTKSTKAEEHLSHGDFHILYDNYEPVIGIRTTNGSVNEIQGRANNADIPLEYLDDVMTFMTKKGLDYGFVQGYIDFAYDKAFEINRMKKICAKEIEANDGYAILRKFNMHPEDVEGGKSLRTIHAFENEVTLGDIGINENEVFKDLVKIEENAIFTNSKATKLPKLEYIGGDADFRNSSIQDISSLKEVDGNVYIAGCNLSADDFKNVKINGELITGKKIVE